MDKIIIAIVQNNGKILMVRRRVKEGDLHWQFPGGSLEEESEFNAAEREVFEETDIKCKAIKSLGERIHPSTKKQINYVLCEYVSGDLTVKDNDELDDAVWMAPAQVFQNITSDIFLPVKIFLENLTTK